MTLPSVVRPESGQLPNRDGNMKLGQPGRLGDHQAPILG